MRYLALAVLLAACSGSGAPTGVVVTPEDGNGATVDTSAGLDAARAGDAVADAAGDTKAGADSGEVGGSRLKPYYLVAADGTRERAGWFDPELGTRCYFTITGGLTVCLPFPGTAGVGASIAVSPRYLDDACTDRIIKVSTPPGADGCSEGDVALINESLFLPEPVEVVDACGKVSVRTSESTYRWPGARIVLPVGALVYEHPAKAPETCAPVKDHPVGAVYRPGPVVPLSAFVSGTFEIGD